MCPSTTLKRGFAQKVVTASASIPFNFWARKSRVSSWYPSSSTTRSRVQHGSSEEAKNTSFEQYLLAQRPLQVLSAWRQIEEEDLAKLAVPVAFVIGKFRCRVIGCLDVFDIFDVTSAVSRRKFLDSAIVQTVSALVCQLLFKHQLRQSRD
jgi:hypothetical protein